MCTAAPCSDVLPTLLASRARVSDEPLKRRRPIPEALQMPEEPSAASTRQLLRVKNTFIECDVQPSPAWEHLHRTRVPQTCPSKHIGRLVSLADELAAPPGLIEIPATPPGLPTPCNIQTPLADALAPAHVLPPWGSMLFGHPGLGSRHVLPSGPAAAAPFLASASLDPQPVALHAGDGSRPVLNLSDALLPSGVPLSIEPCAATAPWLAAPAQPPRYDVSCLGAPAVSQGVHAKVSAWGLPPVSPPQSLAPTAAELERSSSSGLEIPSAPTQLPSPPLGPAPGSQELPSIGSASHGTGTCKPCAFLHTKGCGNGFTCNFCHLCGPDEKRQRRKQKMQQQREEMRDRKERQAAAAIRAEVAGRAVAAEAAGDEEQAADEGLVLD